MQESPRHPTGSNWVLFLVGMRSAQQPLQVDSRRTQPQSIMTDNNNDNVSMSSNSSHCNKSEVPKDNNDDKKPEEADEKHNCSISLGGELSTEGLTHYIVIFCPSSCSIPFRLALTTISRRNSARERKLRAFKLSMW